MPAPAGRWPPSMSGARLRWVGVTAGAVRRPALDHEGRSKDETRLRPGIIVRRAIPPLIDRSPHSSKPPCAGRKWHVCLWIQLLRCPRASGGPTFIEDGCTHPHRLFERWGPEVPRSTVDRGLRVLIFWARAGSSEAERNLAARPPVRAGVRRFLPPRVPQRARPHILLRR